MVFQVHDPVARAKIELQKDFHDPIVVKEAYGFIRAAKLEIRKKLSDPVGHFLSLQNVADYFCLSMPAPGSPGSVALYLDAERKLIESSYHQHGLPIPREFVHQKVLLTALDVNAAYVVFGERQPTADIRPPPETIAAASTLRSELNRFSIGLLDHLVISRLAYTSLYQTQDLLVPAALAPLRTLDQSTPKDAPARKSRSYDR